MPRNEAMKRIALRLSSRTKDNAEKGPKPVNPAFKNIATMMVSRNPRGKRFGKGASDAE
jgi:hypothetical protein